ncbi:MAG: radical SAM protein [Prevotella sp.]|nr:radical SAM protein [Prevotella sp.]
MECPVIGISRHRIATDGEGVTTLVAFHQCTLRCKYCLNPQSLDARIPCQVLTPEQLYETTLVDNLYFLATGGGVTFGGGEPALRHAFIRRFREVCNPEWIIFIETAINVPQTNVEALIPVVDHFIIDVKDTHPDIYHAYTGGDVERVLSNLRFLASKGIQERVTIRLPLIPGYNTTADIDESEQMLREMGFKTFDRFEYLTPDAMDNYILKKSHDDPQNPNDH